MTRFFTVRTAKGRREPTGPPRRRRTLLVPLEELLRHGVVLLGNLEVDAVRARQQRPLGAGDAVGRPLRDRRRALVGRPRRHERGNADVAQLVRHAPARQLARHHELAHALHGVVDPVAHGVGIRLANVYGTLAQRDIELLAHRGAHDLGAAGVLHAHALEVLGGLGTGGLQRTGGLGTQLRHLVREARHGLRRLGGLRTLELAARGKLALEHGRELGGLGLVRLHRRSRNAATYETTDTTASTTTAAIRGLSRAEPAGMGPPHEIGATTVAGAQDIGAARRRAAGWGQREAWPDAAFTEASRARRGLLRMKRDHATSARAAPAGTQFRPRRPL